MSVGKLDTWSKMKFCISCNIFRKTPILEYSTFPGPKLFSSTGVSKSPVHLVAVQVHLVAVQSSFSSGSSPFSSVEAVQV